VDKLDRLKAVLRGHPVKLTDETFCASNHPLGISLCKSLLAKQLLIQGEKVVEAQFKDAFTISWVIVALWDEFPGTFFDHDKKSRKYKRKPWRFFKKPKPETSFLGLQLLILAS